MDDPGVQVAPGLVGAEPVRQGRRLERLERVDGERIAGGEELGHHGGEHEEQGHRAGQALRHADPARATGRALPPGAEAELRLELEVAHRALTRGSAMRVATSVRSVIRM